MVYVKSMAVFKETLLGVFKSRVDAFIKDALIPLGVFENPSWWVLLKTTCRLQLVRTSQSVKSEGPKPWDSEGCLVIWGWPFSLF